MKREIKFRAWDNKLSLMLFEIAVGDGFCGIQEEDTVSYYKSYHDKDLIPMQFTGLQDKNGKDIYEGDIVKIYIGAIKQPYINLIVSWSNEYATYVTNAKMAGYYETLTEILGDDHQPEIIGNIYENPELIAG